ncbi:hypothetical protein M2360_004229 [Rhizobium sp. SG_E_25_P2]|uniref:DUF4279 domain-containing protein n=1 Tax=Rhizobium sp. SG_E_25_P2 TaxID=2879942 RepID=UPI002474EC00|nr:DUF4279 domain-containing protein [Rhizobium sp. SG_E_25_P2]MDH6268811.1 hypothetical protein [Rhizobium sp. SG_E_25_P2]
MVQFNIIDDDNRRQSCTFALSLRIMGDALIPDDITRLMGRSPDLAYTKGGVFHTPNGREVHGRTGMWSVRGPREVEGEFYELVAAFLAGLPASTDVWRMVAKDLKIELFVGVFMGKPNTGFVLSPKVMALLAERNCEIGFDLYGLFEDE